MYIWRYVHTQWVLPTHSRLSDVDGDGDGKIFNFESYFKRDWEVDCCPKLANHPPRWEATVSPTDDHEDKNVGDHEDDKDDADDVDNDDDDDDKDREQTGAAEALWLTHYLCPTLPKQLTLHKHCKQIYIVRTQIYITHKYTLYVHKYTLHTNTH